MNPVYFWHRPMIPAAKLGMHWHVYNRAGNTLCGEFALVGLSRPADARERMPSRATAQVCAKCEEKRPAQIHFRDGADSRSKP